MGNRREGSRHAGNFTSAPLAPRKLCDEITRGIAELTGNEDKTGLSVANPVAMLFGISSYQGNIGHAGRINPDASDPSDELPGPSLQLWQVIPDRVGRRSWVGYPMRKGYPTQVADETARMRYPHSRSCYA
jgi:hypothetical protein